MKRLLLIIIFLCSFFTATQAQISLNYSDLGVPVRSYDIRIDSAVNAAIVPGLAGTNQTWNFIALHKNLDSLKLNLENSNNGIMHAFFPNANVAYHVDTLLNYNYFKSSTLGLLHYGIVSDYLGTGDSIKVVFTQPDTIVKIPGAYGDSTISIAMGDSKSACTYHLDTTIGPVPVQVPIDSVRIKHWQVHYAKFDAWGTMNTPINSYPALRQKNYISTLDTIWAYFDCSGFPAPYDTNTGWHLTSILFDTTLNYTWWMKGLGIPAMRMYMHSFTGNVVDKVEWVRDVVLSVPENEVSNPGIYPNPASDFIRITNAGVFTKAFIYDMLGNEVNRQHIQNMNEITFAVGNLPDGMYFYNLIGRTDKFSGKFVVKH
jgi:hypothetical protein